MLDLIEELRALVAALDAAPVEFAVCGGLAVAIHVAPRATLDVDLLLPRSALEAARGVARGLGYFSEGAVEVHRLSKPDPETEDLLSLGLLVVSEETYPSAPLGLVHQVQEIARYNRQHLVGVVHGHGNSRGDVVQDPRRPLEQARELGRSLFTAPASDYRFDTPRGRSVWSG